MVFFSTNHLDIFKQALILTTRAFFSRNIICICILFFHSYFGSVSVLIKAPTPPLTQSQSTDKQLELMLGKGRGRCAVPRCLHFFNFFGFFLICKRNFLQKRIQRKKKRSKILLPFNSKMKKFQYVGS